MTTVKAAKQQQQQTQADGPNPTSEAEPHNNNNNSNNNATSPTNPAILTLDWTDPSDPSNPRNFTLRRRLLSTAAVTFLAFVSTFAGSIYAPAAAQITAQFHVSDEVAILPLALYNAGLAFGPSFGAPLCETFGRKVVFLVTTPVFALFTLAGGLAQNAAALVVCRFFAGVFASPAVSNASATIVDYTEGKDRALSFAFYYSIPFTGAVFGPLLGGFIVEYKGWRWTQWTTLFFVATFYVPIFFTRETYKKTILQQRAKRLGQHLPHNRSLVQSIHHFATVLLLRPTHMIATEPIVTLICIYSAFMFGLMYSFVVASPWVYAHYYAFTPVSQSLSFLGMIAGTSLAPIPLIIIDTHLYQPRLRAFQTSHNTDADADANARFPPENRLFPAMCASVLLPASLFGFAWTARPEIHWIVPVLFQGAAMMLAVMVYSSANLFMLDVYGPLYGASAAGAAMLSRYALSAAFPLFALRMYRALGVGWATTVLACAALAMAPIPWLFWRYGEGLRGRMRYESSV